MGRVFKPSIGVLVLLLSGCDLNLKQAKTPPAPQPTVARAAPPPPVQAPTEPLSTPQTQVRLPQPQPIDPEAVVTPPVPPEPVPQRPKRRRPSAPAASPTKPETVETAEAPPPTEAPAHRLEPVIPEGQRIQRMEEISARLKEVEQTLKRVNAGPLNDAQKHTAEQIRNFADQAYKAKDQGDIQKASGLADRAQLLLQDLARGR
jgi:hypothetical protein